MSELKYLKAFLNDGPYTKRVASLAVCIVILDNKEMSSHAIAQTLNLDINKVSLALAELKREGWIERVRFEKIYVDWYDARLSKTLTGRRRHGVYRPTLKLDTVMI